MAFDFLNQIEEEMNKDTREAVEGAVTFEELREVVIQHLNLMNQERAILEQERAYFERERQDLQKLKNELRIMAEDFTDVSNRIRYQMDLEKYGTFTTQKEEKKGKTWREVLLGF